MEPMVSLMSAELLRVLVIDDDKPLAAAIAESLSSKGHACTVATSGKAGAAKIDDGDYDVVLTDLKNGRQSTGLAIVKCSARKSNPRRTSTSSAARATSPRPWRRRKLGAANFLLKPLESDGTAGDRREVRRAARVGPARPAVIGFKTTSRREVRL